MSLKLGETVPDFERDWTPASVDGDTVPRFFNSGWSAPKPYLRTVKQPA